MVMKKTFSELLLGSDLRRLMGNHKVAEAVFDQASFDELFGLVFHHERALVMHAVDAVEKITQRHPAYLNPHKDQLMAVLKSADHKELKWHIAQLLPRVVLLEKELNDVWHILSYWSRNTNESRVVRVNALQGLFDLSRQHPDRRVELNAIIGALEHELIPSLQTRIRKLKKMLIAYPDRKLRYDRVNRG